MNPIIFIGTDLSDLAKTLSNWLREISDVAGENAVLCFDEDANTQNLIGNIESRKNDSILVIFYGIGIPRAFLTALHLGYREWIKEKNLSLLCEAKHFNACEKVRIIGFCCSSAKVFGETIRKTRNENKFLGYNSKIGFVLETEEREKAFKSPIEKIVQRAINNNDIELAASAILKKLYIDEQKKWARNIYNDNKALLVSMLLGMHADALDPKIKEE